MDSFAHLLIALAHATLAIWAAIKSFFGWVGSLLDAVLQPILSPLLQFLNPICTTIADAVYKVLDLFPPWVGLILISAVAGAVMLVAFGRLSNQAGIGRAKDDIKSNLLALKLFKDDLRVALRAQLRIAWALLRLQRYTLVPILWLIFPTMLLLSQMAMRYQWRPFAPGETILVKLHGGAGNSEKIAWGDQVAGVTLSAPDGVTVEAGPIAGESDVAWRLRAVTRGRYQLSVNVSGGGNKEVVVGSPVQRVSPVRPAKRWTQQILYPVEPVLPGDSAMRRPSIEIHYPALKSKIYGSDYWVLTFFVVSMVTAIVLRPVFRVRF